jgi:hypothetical protein
VTLPFERPLYTPAARTPIDSSVQAGVVDADPAALLDQVYVDRAHLAGQVRQSLAQRRRVGLSELLTDHPLQHGLAELVGYLSLTDASFRLVFDEAAHERVSWTDGEGTQRGATLPRATFVRTVAAEGASHDLR